MASKSLVWFQKSWFWDVPGLCKGDPEQWTLAKGRAGRTGLSLLGHEELDGSLFAAADSGSSPLRWDGEGAELGGARQGGGGCLAGLGAWELGFNLQLGFSRAGSPVPPRIVQSKTKLSEHEKTDSPTAESLAGECMCRSGHQEGTCSPPSLPRLCGFCQAQGQEISVWRPGEKVKNLPKRDCKVL